MNLSIPSGAVHPGPLNSQGASGAQTSHLLGDRVMMAAIAVSAVTAVALGANFVESGLAWGLFPNQNILPGVTFALCYRVRPYGDDPNKCFFESYAQVFIDDQVA